MTLHCNACENLESSFPALQLLAPAPEVEVNFSEADLEEWAKRAKEFSSQSMKAHREHQRVLLPN